MRSVWLEDSFMYLSVLLVRDLISKIVLKRAGPLSEVLLQWIHSSIKPSLTQTVTLFYLCMQVLRFYVAKTSVTATLTQKQSKRAFAPNWIAHKSEVSPPPSRAHCSQRHGVIYARRRWMWGVHGEERNELRDSLTRHGLKLRWDLRRLVLSRTNSITLICPLVTFWCKNLHSFEFVSLPLIKRETSVCLALLPARLWGPVSVKRLVLELHAHALASSHNISIYPKLGYAHQKNAHRPGFVCITWGELLHWKQQHWLDWMSLIVMPTGLWPSGWFAWIRGAVGPRSARLLSVSMLLLLYSPF